jgi:hypothetical protein
VIEAAIHARWASVDELTELIPASKFTTGSELSGDESGSESSGLPIAVLTVQGSQKHRHNNGHATLTTVRVQAWVRDHFDGVSLQNPMQLAFENTDWSITLNGQTCSVIESRIENEYAIQEEDGCWQFIFDLELLSNVT